MTSGEVPLPRRVLLIARDFPPAAGAPAIRMAKLARYLPHHGWQPVVLTTPEDHAWHSDPSLVDELPADLEVHRIARLLSGAIAPVDERSRTGAAPHGRRSHRRRRLAGRLTYPDPGILWVVRAARIARRLGHRVDAVLTSAPPFSTHLLGLLLGPSGLPWVADYRDNWTMNPAIARRGPAGVLDRALERRILARADGITVVSERARHEVACAFDVPAARISVALNGYDPADLPEASETPPEFAIRYLGSMDARRDPRPFLQALREAIRTEPSIGRDLRVRLVGDIPDWVDPTARAILGPDRIEVVPPMAHRDALAEGGRAAVLLCISSRAEAGGAAMTSKLLEYLGLRRPILMLAPDGPGTALVRSLGAGAIADPDDVPAITAAVLGLYRDWRAGTQRVALPDRLVDLTRQRTAATVAAALDEAVARRKRAPK